MFKVILVLMSIFALSSCVSTQYYVEGNECAEIDWRVRGKMDAYKGKPKSSFGDLREYCARYGEKANRAKYVKGYIAGENTFCSVRGGWVYGSTGKEYDFDCPEESEKDFLKGYRDGRTDYTMNRLNDKLDRYEEKNKSDDKEPELSF